ncbi:MAG: DUF2608 domain-containing protein [bacterium]|nr:DUF2608 domain-containing protein [bacterium]
MTGSFSVTAGFGRVCRCVLLAGTFAALACASTPVPEPMLAPRRTDVSSWADVEATIDEIASRVPPDRILVVADIDRTVLRPVRFAGSDEWYDWQGKLPENDVRAECLFTSLGLLLELSRMAPTEEVVDDVLQRLRSTGIQVLFLTARNPGYRWATERELERLGLLDASDPREGLPGAGWPWVRTVPGLARPISVANSVAMVAGQNKGVALRWILEELGMAPEALVMVDNKPSNNDTVASAFSGADAELWLFDYVAQPRADAESEQAEWIARWPEAWRNLRALTMPRGQPGVADCPNG